MYMCYVSVIVTIVTIYTCILVLFLQSQIVIYDIAGRHEVTRKELENTIGMPVVRHLTSLEASTLICTTGREVQLIPTGLKMKTE